MVLRKSLVRQLCHHFWREWFVIIRKKWQRLHYIINFLDLRPVLIGHWVDTVVFVVNIFFINPLYRCKTIFKVVICVSFLKIFPIVRLGKYFCLKLLIRHWIDKRLEKICFDKPILMVSLNVLSTLWSLNRVKLSISQIFFLCRLDGCLKLLDSVFIWVSRFQLLLVFKLFVFCFHHWFISITGKWLPELL